MVSGRRFLPLKRAPKPAYAQRQSEIWKGYSSTGKAHAEVLQNLIGTSEEASLMKGKQGLNREMCRLKEGWEACMCTGSLCQHIPSPESFILIVITLSCSMMSRLHVASRLLEGKDQLANTTENPCMQETKLLSRPEALGVAQRSMRCQATDTDEHARPDHPLRLFSDNASQRLTRKGIWGSRHRGICQPLFPRAEGAQPSPARLPTGNMSMDACNRGQVP